MKKKKQNARMKSWKGSRWQKIDLLMPSQFLMFCALVDKPINQILTDFMNNVGMESFGLGDEQKNLIKEYLLSCEYGQDRYTYEEITQILDDLKSISSLWPKDAKIKIVNTHSKWRDKYHKYWFKKWYWKLKRKV